MATTRTALMGPSAQALKGPDHVIAKLPGENGVLPRRL